MSAIHNIARLAFILLLFAPWMESRYLPTRGDDSRTEDIRSILAELLEKVSSRALNDNAASVRQINGFEKRFLTNRGAKSAFSPSYPADRFFEDYAVQNDVH